MTKDKNRNYGIIAEFDTPGALLKAAEEIRKAGYEKFDCHSPFPIHGMDEAMGLKRSPLGWIVGIMALTGAGVGMLLQWWTSAVDYQLVISGKPFFSYQAFVPVTFGLAVLFGAISTVVGMLYLNRLPQLYHPVFYSDRFNKVTDNGFFVSISSDDSHFDPGKSSDFLKDLGSKYVEVLKNT